MDELFRVAYDDLRPLAQFQLSREHGPATLSTTEFVHEVYLALPLRPKALCGTVITCSAPQLEPSDESSLMRRVAGAARKEGVTRRLPSRSLDGSSGS